MGAADPEPRPRSIADMLVEPEGYPAPDEATLPLTSNEMSVESDDMPEPTTALDTTMPDGTTPDAEAPRKSYAEMLLKPDCFPHEHDERQPADDAQNEQSANSSENTPAPNERISRIRKRVGANERRRRLAETAASRQSFGIGGVGRHSLHSPAKFQSDVRRQATRSAVTSRWKATCKATARSSSTKRHLQSSTTNEPALSTLTPRKCVKHPVKTFADYQWHTFVHDMSANAQKSTHPIIWRRS